MDFGIEVVFDQELISTADGQGELMLTLLEAHEWNFTILQPLHYMQNIPVARLLETKQYVNFKPLSKKLGYVDGVDIAEVVANVLQQGDRHQYATYELGGASFLSIMEIELQNDLDSALAIYEDKRFEVTGVAIKIGPDVHSKPAIEISDKADGRCYALCIFPASDFYEKVSVGDIVTVRANYLVLSNWFGVVMKYSELVGVEKPL